ncbi:MAG: hypothetical protein ACKVT2_07750 [Saprospiraceae bacterium]
MKHIDFILLFTLMVILAACKKEEPSPIDPIVPDPPPIYVPIFEPGDTSFGAAYANKLTALWSANTYCKKSIFDPNKLSIIFFTYTSDGSQRESLGFSYFSKTTIDYYNFTTALTGINNLPHGETFTSYGTWISDGDVLQDYYLVDSTDIKNRLVITKIDLANKRVEGTFHASYNIQEPHSNPLNPKKVTFSEGRFWATIRD